MGKRTKSSKKSRKGRQSAGSRNWLYLVFSAAMVLAIGLGGLMVFGGGSPQPQAEPIKLPAWVARAPFQVQEAYAYVAEHPETTGYIPCYCGCGGHSGHLSVHDCFVAARGTDGSIVYDPHGAGCDMCVDIALITKRLVGQGKSLTEVRKSVDGKYSYLGPPTDTPPIPQ
jgi:hypothetical protein